MVQMKIICLVTKKRKKEKKFNTHCCGDLAFAVSSVNLHFSSFLFFPIRFVNTIRKMAKHSFGSVPTILYMGSFSKRITKISYVLAKSNSYTVIQDMYVLNRRNYMFAKCISNYIRNKKKEKKQCLST